MKDFKLCFNSLGYFIQEATKLIQSKKAFRVNIVEWREKRSLSQNSLYWKWLGEIVKQWDVTSDTEILHEIFKKYFCPDKVINEHITIKSTKKLDVGEMCFYLNRIEQFCIDRGFKITIPDNCEYRELLERQDD